MRNHSLYINLFLAIVLSTVVGCKSSRTNSRGRLAVVTYDKKRGSRPASPSQRHYSARSGSRKEESFDFDEKSSSKPRTTSSRASGNTINASGLARTVIQEARSYMGTPYRYGGTSRKGMDCSGLLCTSFQAANIQLPRPSKEQAEYGREVDIEDVKPGDLVFFSERKSSNKVSHVGLVTAVNGRESVTFIHSSSSRGVVEDNLHSDYYRKIFVKAMRPF